MYLAENDADLAAVDMLWNAVYGTEFGWLPPKGGPRHKDRYDDHSTYLMVRVGHQVVGTMRLVVDSAEGLPVEQFVGVDEYRLPGRRLIECQRLMILRDHRNQRFPGLPYGVLGGLVKACVHWCVRNGMTHILADLFTETPTTPIAPLKALGFIETGKEFIDTELEQAGTSIALLLDVGELFSRPFRTSHPFYRYLMEYDEIVDVYH
ncbi:N-acyl amino acid synthase FeeM domain-containing protein [Actinocorallia sp. A-T 12471]|uniref:N-acyl amino acid synthase FeeM domain-containing protein n=1 Tax=Actinocorallia sp. A-T 12471 TaxID=3089813 RepID=UPI0029CF443E|nr:GNAT family N-acyltransferase [Actinocorallia sp. A-T 12471]MDX6742355.1 GNAT family N-acyltransferase [Actinocorallia sp. A-T 12471]